jgi:hypothetical protein
VTTFHTDPEKQFGTIMTVKSEVFPASALSELDGNRRQLARGVRLRDQGHRPYSRPRITGLKAYTPVAVIAEKFHAITGGLQGCRQFRKSD